MFRKCHETVKEICDPADLIASFPTLYAELDTCITELEDTLAQGDVSLLLILKYILL